MTEEQTDELRKLRLKAEIDREDRERRLLINDLLVVANGLYMDGQMEHRDIVHRAIAEIEGPEFDGVL